MVHWSTMWGFMQPFSWASDKAFQWLKLKPLDRIQTIRYRQIVDTDWRAYLRGEFKDADAGFPEPRAPNPEPQVD